MRPRKRRGDSRYNFWQPATDMMSGLVFVLILVIALLGLYILSDYTGYLEDYGASSGASSYPNGDEWEGDSWDDWDGGWNWDDWDGGGGDDNEEEIVAGGGGAYPDEGVKSAVYVELVDAETDRPIQEENIRFELYRTDITHLQEGSLQILNTYYPEKISYRLYATREDGTFYLPEKIWQGNYYFHELNAPEGYDLAADTYFDVNELFDWPEPYVVQIRLSPAKNIIRIQMNDADTQLPVGGGTFWVIAAENIITMDGTVRYTTGQVVDTIYCDEEGYGESDELYLGAYTVQQVGAPEYYASMTETFTAEVEQRTGALPEVHEVEAEKTQIVLHVADELYADQNIGGARFTVTNQRTGLTQQLTTDSAGNAVLTNLEKGVTYTIQQSQTVGDYRPDSDTYEMVVTADGRVNGESSAQLEITNRVLRVVIHPVDAVLRTNTLDQQFALYDSQDNMLESWTSDGQDLVLTDLPEGDYYILHNGDAEQRYTFRVTDTASVQTWTISLFTLRSVVALVLAALLTAGVIGLMVFLIRLAARKHEEARRKKQEEPPKEKQEKETPPAPKH